MKLNKGLDPERRINDGGLTAATPPPRITYLKLFAMDDRNNSQWEMTSSDMGVSECQWVLRDGGMRWGAGCDVSQVI